MLFPTVTFAIFFVVVFVGSWWLRPNRTLWMLFLLGASFFFYGWWDARFVLLLGSSIVGNYLVGNWAAAAIRPDGSHTPLSRAAIVAAVALNLGVLGWFKYYGFFTTSLVNTLGDVGIHISPPLVQVTLPVGISFFTFQALSYVIDIARLQIRPMPFLHFAVYLSFFPQLVAGPIVRAREMAPQLLEDPDPRFIPASEAFRLIFAGLFKKVVISSYLASEIVDPVFAVPGEHSSMEILFATYAYAVQIYADFSGYTDIAIGCALLLGFRFPQNFDSPYAATSIQAFWRRWHMTLSNWLRDYLFIPLGGSRTTKIFTYRNLMITMVLGGLWHGAAWTFVVWGAIHGGALVIERIINERMALRRGGSLAPSRTEQVIRWLITFHIVCLAWIFFRAESFDIATDMLWRIFTAWGPAELVTPLLVAVIAGSIAVQFVPQGFTLRAQWVYSRLGPALQAATFAVGLLMIDALGPEGVAPFIYFQF